MEMKLLPVRGDKGGLYEHPVLQWALFFGITVLLYYSGLSAGFFSDDFQWVFTDPAAQVGTFFYQTAPQAAFYRPLPATVGALLQTVFGLDPVPMHIVNIAFHALLCVVIFRAVLMIGLSRLHAWVAAAVMLLSQAGASAILGQDTFSQIASTSFGCFGLWFLLRAFQYPVPQKGLYLAGLLMYACALASKESGVSFFVVVCAVVVLVSPERRAGRLWMAPALLRILPFVVLTIAYMLVRSNIVTMAAAIGSERYNFALGTNIAVNIVQLIMALIVPVSTVDVYTAHVQGNTSTLAVAGLMSAVVGIVVVWGILAGDAERRSRALVVLALGLCSFFPMALLNHVSELYAYNAMPFFSIGAAVGIVGFTSMLSRKGMRYGAAGIVLFFVAAAGMHIAAVQSKSGLMVRNGIAHQRLVDSLLPFVHALPPNGSLVLLNSSCNVVEYSTYKIHGFNLFEAGIHVLNNRAGRQDVKVVLVDRNKGAGALPAPPAGPYIVAQYTCDGRIVRNDEALREYALFRRRGGSRAAH